MPVPVFCCFCISEKLYRKYSWNCTGQKPKVSVTKPEPEDEVQEGLEGPRQGPGAGPGLAVPGHCLADSGIPSRRLFAYKLSPDLKVTGRREEIHEKFRRGRRRQP